MMRSRLTRLAPALLALAGMLSSAGSQAAGGWVEQCLHRFQDWGKPSITVIPEPGHTQAETWIRSGPKVRAALLHPFQERLSVRPISGREISAEKRAALRQRFEETSKQARKLLDEGLISDARYRKYRQLCLEHALAASGILEANGIRHELRPPLSVDLQYRLEILIEPSDESSMNRLASGLLRLHPDLQLIYDPDRAWKGGYLGSFVHGTRLESSFRPTIHTSEDSILEGIRGSTTLRHEIQHAYHHHRDLTGRSSWLSGGYIAIAGDRHASPFRSRFYGDYMSFDEISTHGQDVRVLLHRLMREPRDPALLNTLEYRSSGLVSLSERLEGVGSYLEEAISALEAAGQRELPGSWEAKIDGGLFRVQLRRSDDAGTSVLEFEFREKTRGMPLRDGPDQRPRAFRAEVRMAIREVHGPQQIERTLERARQIRRQGARAAEFSRALRSLVFPEGGITDQTASALDQELLGKIQKLLDSTPDIRAVEPGDAR